MQGLRDQGEAGRGHNPAAGGQVLQKTISAGRFETQVAVDALAPAAVDDELLAGEFLQHIDE